MKIPDEVKAFYDSHNKGVGAMINRDKYRKSYPSLTEALVTRAAIDCYYDPKIMEKWLDDNPVGHTIVWDVWAHAATLQAKAREARLPPPVRPSQKPVVKSASTAPNKPKRGADWVSRGFAILNTLAILGFLLYYFILETMP